MYVAFLTRYYYVKGRIPEDTCLLCIFILLYLLKTKTTLFHATSYLITESCAFPRIRNIKFNNKNDTHEDMQQQKFSFKIF